MMDVELAWLCPPSALSLPGDEVHVWRAELNQPDARIRLMAQLLSPDECDRAARFHFERDRNHFIVARGVLRIILGRYLSVEPDQIQFGYGARGKPYLAEGMGDGTLCFNLAHSHTLALYAFTRDREIGIDLEHVRLMPDAEQIAARFFSARERAAFDRLPQDQKLLAFFNGWTRKEAFIKAIGEGLAWPLDQFDVSLAPGEEARLLGIVGDLEETARWSLLALNPDYDYVAALAVKDHGCHLRCWTYA